MKRLAIAMFVALVSAASWAQAPAATPVDDAAAKKAADRKAKQEMVKGTTEAAATQYSTAPNRGPAPPSAQRGKPSKEQRQEVMKGASEAAASQYGPAAAAASAKVDKNAPKAVKPDMSDPKVREAMQNQKQ